jgi:hypothetical protein
MAYSIDFREIVLKYIDEINNLRKTKEIFKVNLSTIQGWKRLNVSCDTFLTEKVRH